MKQLTRILLILITITMSINTISAQQNATDGKSGKILIVYYSYGGNTRTVANMILNLTGGDIFEIQPLTPYPADYDELVSQREKEVERKFKPALKNKVENIASYDIIFVDYPISSPMLSFLSEYDLSGKMVISFCTHGGYGKGSSFEALAGLSPKSTIPEGLSLEGTKAKNAQSEITAWLKQIKIVK